MYLAIEARLQSDDNFLNVSSEVLVRCAVQITVRSGNNVHKANTIRPNMNVLATCRAIETVTPPTVAACSPFARFPRTSEPTSHCH